MGTNFRESDMDRLLKRLGLKDEFGWDDPSTFGFIVLWSLIGYGAFIIISALVERFVG